MFEKDWSEYWWSKITGPRELVDLTAAALTSKKNVVISVPDDLPWRHEFRNVVRLELENAIKLDELMVDVIDVNDECIVECNPGQFLLDRYALRDDRIGYRSGGKESIQEYLIRKGVLRNKILWIKGFGQSDPGNWLHFIKNWSIDDVGEGIFVVEINEVFKPVDSKTTTALGYDDLVGAYDSRLFGSLLIGDNKTDRLSTEWKKYAVALTSSLCGTDAEIIYEFVRLHDFKHCDPIDTIREIADLPDFEKRGCRDHVLDLCRTQAISDLRKRIWEGQLETIFPLIEFERLNIIDKYRNQLKRELESGIVQFDRRIDDPDDIELGTLVYLCVSRRIDVEDSEVYRRIHFLRDCRNFLAHRKICSVEDVSRLIDG